jgi:hypothetical protein
MIVECGKDHQAGELGEGTWRFLYSKLSALRRATIPRENKNGACWAGYAIETYLAPASETTKAAPIGHRIRSCKPQVQISAAESRRNAKTAPQVSLSNDSPGHSRSDNYLGRSRATIKTPPCGFAKKWAGLLVFEHTAELASIENGYPANSSILIGQHHVFAMPKNVI